MAPLDGIAGVWKNLQELDLRPIREMAEKEVRLAVVGREGSGRHDLAAQMLTDRAQSSIPSRFPILITSLHDADSARDADLIILMLGPADQDDAPERALAHAWNAAGRKLLVFRNQPAAERGAAELPQWVGWAPARVVAGPAHERAFLEGPFTAAVLDSLPDQRLALSRCFPLFRITVARHLINEACISNATYSLGTGFAEIVPVLDLPLNITDMLVLTKGQALLVYKLGLALGLPTDWQYYLGEFGGVIGSGFLWRQLARSLIGLVPAFGIVPKVAIAYSGTYAVGEVVLQWYLTGRHVTRAQMQTLYKQAYQQGKALASDLAGRLPKPRMRMPPIPHIRLPTPAVPRLLRRSPQELPLPIIGPKCQNCGTENDPDAAFCKHCGRPLSHEP